MSSEDMVHAPSRVLSPSAEITHAQVEALRALGASALAFDRAWATFDHMNYVLNRWDEPVVAALAVAQDDLKKAARTYARSLEERSEQAAIPTTQQGE